MRRIIFADRDGTVRAPMASGILMDMMDDDELLVSARGLVVLFPEPLNQKAEAVMASNGIRLNNYSSTQLVKEDVDADTVLILIEPGDMKRTIDIIGEENSGKVRVLGELCGDELPVMDPYGGVIGTYGICFETMSNTIRKLLGVLPVLWGNENE